MKKYELQIISGILSGILTFLITFLITFYWQIQGFTPFRALLLSILSSFLYMIILIPTNIISVRKFLKNEIITNGKAFRRYPLLIIFVSSLLAFLIFDTVFFLFDDSLSRDYLQFLNSVEPNPDLESTEEILPMGLMNVFQMLIFGLISILISLVFIKKKPVAINEKH